MKKNLLTVLILALLIVNIVLNVVMMVSVMGTNKQTAALVKNIATVMNLELTVPGEEAQKQEVSLADTEVYSIAGAMTVPLKAEVITDSDGSQKTRQGYIMFEIAFSQNTKHKDYSKYGGEKLAEKETLIKDVVTTVVSSRTETECRDFDALKAAILKEVQNLFGSDFIYKVSINEVKFG